MLILCLNPRTQAQGNFPLHSKDMKNNRVLTRILYVAFFVIVILIVGKLSYGFGVARERMRWYDNEDYWFRKYSEHLNGLVKQQRITELTNNIIFFDTRFQSNTINSPEFTDVMYQILKLGPYSTEKP